MANWWKTICIWNLHHFLNPNFIPKNFQKKNWRLKQLFRWSCKTWFDLSNFWKTILAVYIRRRRLQLRWHDKLSLVRFKHPIDEYQVNALAGMYAYLSRYQLHYPSLLLRLCYHTSLCSSSDKHVYFLKNFFSTKTLIKRCSKKERN